MRYVSKRLRMIIVSRFKLPLWCSIVFFISGIGAYFRLVYHTLVETFTIQRSLYLDSVFVQNARIMLFNQILYVGHWAVPDLSSNNCHRWSTNVFRICHVMNMNSTRLSLFTNQLWKAVGLTTVWNSKHCWKRKKKQKQESHMVQSTIQFKWKHKHRQSISKACKETISQVT